MLQKSEEKNIKKRERVPLSSFISPKSSPQQRKMNTTLASSPGVPKDTIHKILNEDFVIPKKSARWVTKFLSHISAVVGDWFAAVAFQCLENPLYLLDLFLAYFFLLPHMKEALAEQKPGLGTPFFSVLFRAVRYILFPSKTRTFRSFPFFSRVFGDL